MDNHNHTNNQHNNNCNPAMNAYYSSSYVADVDSKTTAMSNGRGSRSNGIANISSNSMTIDEKPKNSLSAAHDRKSKPAVAASIVNNHTFTWMALSHQPLIKELDVFIQTIERLQQRNGPTLQRWHLQLLRKTWVIHNDHCQAYWKSLDKILKTSLGKHMDIPSDMTAERDDVLFYCALITSLLDEGRPNIIEELTGLLRDHRNTLTTVCALHKERFIPLFQAFCSPQEMVTMVQKTLSVLVKACDGAWMYHHGIESLLKEIFQEQDMANAYSWIDIFENLSQAYDRSYMEPLRALQENLQPFCVFD